MSWRRIVSGSNVLSENIWFAWFKLSLGGQKVLLRYLTTKPNQEKIGGRGNLGNARKKSIFGVGGVP